MCRDPLKKFSLTWVSKALKEVKINNTKDGMVNFTFQIHEFSCMRDKLWWLDCLHLLSMIFPNYLWLFEDKSCMPPLFFFFSPFKRAFIYSIYSWHLVLSRIFYLFVHVGGSCEKFTIVEQDGFQTFWRKHDFRIHILERQLWISFSIRWYEFLN